VIKSGRKGKGEGQFQTRRANCNLKGGRTGIHLENNGMRAYSLVWEEWEMPSAVTGIRSAKAWSSWNPGDQRSKKIGKWGFKEKKGLDTWEEGGRSGGRLRDRREKCNRYLSE